MTAEEQLNTWWKDWKCFSPVRIDKFNRQELVKHFAEWGFEKGAEVGVDRGRFSEFMLDNIPGLKLFCIDLWWWRFRGESRYQSTVDRLKRFGDQPEILRMGSMEAVKLFKDESLDFVFIDADHHFDFVMQDIIEWSKKVRIGGIVSGHDYVRFRTYGVVDAVDAYTKAHSINPWFLCDTRTPSWFWMKKVNPWEEWDEEDGVQD